MHRSCLYHATFLCDALHDGLHRRCGKALVSTPAGLFLIGPWPTSLDATAVITGAGYDLAVTKQADTTYVRPGDAVRFTLAVSRSGTLTGTLRLTDTVVPTAALAAWTMPSNCAGITTTGQITCAWMLPPADLFTRTFDVVITTTAHYTGLLINGARIGAEQLVLEKDYINNVSQVVVAVDMSGPPATIYLPLVLRNYASSRLS
ncbi:MAG: hypothetical protein U9Q70_13230 [Chloroflexota bacterium]|nr:hypothetical protein [Chloroflexota bacterium]